MRRLYPSTIILLITTGILISLCMGVHYKINNLEQRISTIQDQQLMLSKDQARLSEAVLACLDSWQVSTFETSAYSPLDDQNGLNSWGDGSVMYSGAATADNIGTAVSVDPDVIPIGSKVYIEGIGWRTAMDTGGAIDGYRLDIPMQTFDQAMEYGVKKVVVLYPKEAKS
ncbi:3D domain-containing protein [Dehalobacter restrictus]|uniref:3D domain-containing protein n=1 Tax=Dehalobacter restrictus TaxID=55583 RepID=UPI00338EE711